MSIARATRISQPKSIIALAAKRKSRSTLFLAAHERKLPKAALDTQSYSVATVSARRARSVGNRQKRLSLVPGDNMGIIAGHVDGRKSRSCALTKHAKGYKL